jgi:macrolide transport system ATP-binding/permease protein
MKFIRKLRALFRREKLDAEMAEEMRGHLEMQTTENEKHGLPPDEARYAARRAFGGEEQLKERARDARGLRWLYDFGRDLRFALRVIAKAPMMSAVIVLSLALGLGANTAVFSWIHTVALAPVPGVRDGRHLMMIEQKSPAGLIEFASIAEWRDVRQQAGSFADVAAHNFSPYNLEAGAEVVHLWGENVTENFFAVLGASPALGRWPAREDDLPGSASVAVISHRLWQKQFGGQNDIVGRVIRLNNSNTTIIGVAQPEFQGAVTALAFDLWLPQGHWWNQEDRKQRAFQLIGRLRPSTSVGQADADVALVFQRLAEKFPDSNRGMTADVIPFWRSRAGAEALIVPTLATMQVVMVLLLLVVCTNTANLLLAQATSRSKEIAIRLSIGAGRARVVRQLVTEGLLLAVAGAALGTLFAYYGLWLINGIPKPAGLPVALAARFEYTELLFSIGLAVVCAIGFSLVPALQTTRANVGDALKLGGRNSGPGRRKLQEALVGAEIALTLVIVIMAGLFVKSFQNARFARQGFEPQHVVLGVFDPASQGYDAKRTRAFAETLLARVQEQPNVQSAALSTWVPLDLRPMRPIAFTLEGRVGASERTDQTLWQEVSRGYFATLHIGLSEGGDFSAVTEQPGEAEAVINEEFHRRYFTDGQAAVGRRLTARGATYRIVGVARTTKYGTLSEAPQPMVYFSVGGRWAYFTLMVRTTQDPTTVFPTLRQVVHGLDGGMLLFDQRTFEQHLDQAMILRVIPAKILSILGPLALFLAVTGLYSVLAYAVAQRTHEIGVRMTLGATTREVVFLILRQGLVAVAGGIALGWLGAYFISVRLSRELVEVPAGDPLLFICLPLLLATVAVLACWLPARRAAKVDPIVALRAE